jgi:hypothetical protein
MKPKKEDVMNKMLPFVIIVVGYGLSFGYFSTELKAEKQGDEESFKVGDDQVVMEGNSISIVGHPTEEQIKKSEAETKKRLDEEGRLSQEFVAERQNAAPEQDSGEAVGADGNYAQNDVVAPGYVRDDLEDPLDRRAGAVALDERREGGPVDTYQRPVAGSFARRR